MAKEAEVLKKEYKLGETQERIHTYLIDIKKCYMSKIWFENNNQLIDQLKPYKDYATFEYYAEIYLWQTFFKYSPVILKYIVSTAKEVHGKNKLASEDARAIIFFFHCMSVAPEYAPPIEKKETKTEKENTPLTVEDFLKEFE